MSNLETLIQAAKKKHAAELKAELKEIREKAAREEEQLFARAARLMEQREPDRFVYYRDQAASLIEQEREQEKKRLEQERAARSARAKASHARRKEQPGLVWFCGPGVLRVVGCYWWCCAHWRAYWLGESQPSALWGCSSL